MARVTVKDLRAEARRRLLHCGNGKTISRMNKKELITFLDCIAGSKNVQVQQSIQSKARLQTATDDQIGPGNLFAQPRRRKKRVPRKANPIEANSDDEDEPGALGGAGLPSTYREFVKAMLPHVRAKGLGPQAAIKTVAMMWRKHKSQRGAGLTMAGNGLTLAGAQRGMGAAGTVSDVAGGISGALGAAGLAAGATGVGLVATPFLEAGAAAAGGVATAAKGVDYIESLFS
eukprot:COSAG02_NODE_16502_length_1078_cov_1.762002_1_plen_231_part_00